MKKELFDEVVKKMLDDCLKVLEERGQEYSPADDRLENFKHAAALQGIRPSQALAGMMAKHTIALYDFIRTDYQDLDQWHEKLRDTINYCLLLKALRYDEHEEF